MTLITDLIQIIYASQPFGYDNPTLSGILLDARKCNMRDDVTGALVCRHDVYLQLLEGPPAKVRATLTRIRRDDRHLNVKTLLSEPISNRLFEEWSMLHDPAKSVIWSPSEVSAGAIERATPSDYRQLFEALAKSAKSRE
ncbi:BLUF domain-containing protein [uncultured Litoreibacter sp.]|uniref:BLUF domain-containing protein n=1 Tax=uncultured Litoreibacter sp. TaxID=1392394 RepID=UPI0026350723|nr:BLUF domain-containing protein [uncultured Litoreibacter sp.]